MGTSDATPKARPFDDKAILLLLSVGAIIAYVYSSQLDRSTLSLRMTLHDQIIDNTALSPYRYRILIPLIAEAFARVLSAACSREIAFRLAYAICDLTAVAVLLIALFVWLREWFSTDRSLIGVLFVAGTMPIALQDHYFQPWSLPETALLAAALLAVRRRRYGVLAGLVAVASLNRETAVFIPLAFLVTGVDFRKLVDRRKSEVTPMLLSVGLFALWLAIFWGLRYFRGSAAPVATISGLLHANTTPGNLARAVLNGSLFLGVFWAFAVLGYRSAPRFVQRLAWIIPPYVVTVGLWGVWYEVRLLMPLYPVLIPMGLSFVYREEATDEV